MLNTFFRSQQSVYISFGQYLLSATVIKAELIQIGAKEFETEVNVGRIVDQTDISFRIKEGEKLRTLKAPD